MIVESRQFFFVGHFCVLSDVQQHPWPLPSREQGYSSSRSNRKVSRSYQILPFRQNNTSMRTIALFEYLDGTFNEYLLLELDYWKKVT